MSTADLIPSPPRLTGNEYWMLLVPSNLMLRIDTKIDGKTRSNKQTYNVLFFRDIISYNLIFEKKIMLIRKVSAMKDGS